MIRKIRQNELAPKLKISCTYMSLIERGEKIPSTELLIRWCELLDCELRIIPKL